MKLETGIVKNNTEITGDYSMMTLECPAVASSAKPGQFIHMQIPELDHAVLRRPFSIYKADDKLLTILYKRVGKGTAKMNSIPSNIEISIMGPLGKGFPLNNDNKYPVLIAGGYGVAPLCYLAEKLESKGIVFIGAGSEDDVLCVKDFQDKDWDVRITTDDGSVGEKGLVTAALSAWLAEDGAGKDVEYYACGPDGMLKALGGIAIDSGVNAWLSLDKHMGCGVGACLACVQKVKDADGDEVWGRVCKDGPVFESRTIVW